MTKDEANEEPLANEAIALAKSIHPLLDGKPAPVIGAALADLTSLLIAGHIGDTPYATKQVQEAVLEEHIKAIKRLIPLQAAMLRTRMEQPSEKPN